MEESSDLSEVLESQSFQPTFCKEILISPEEGVGLSAMWGRGRRYSPKQQPRTFFFSLGISI